MIRITLTSTQDLARRLVGDAANNEIENILSLTFIARQMPADRIAETARYFAEQALEAREIIRAATAYEIVIDDSGIEVEGEQGA